MLPSRADLVLGLERLRDVGLAIRAATVREFLGPMAVELVSAPTQDAPLSTQERLAQASKYVVQVGCWQ